MSKTNVATISITVSGDGFTGPVFSAVLTNTSGTAPGSVTLAAGFNSVPVPASALGVCIVPPVNSANIKTIKGITGDTGQQLGTATVTVFTFTAAQIANLGITSTSAETLTLLWL
jgi:hypothetical protein